MKKIILFLVFVIAFPAYGFAGRIKGKITVEGRPMTDSVKVFITKSDSVITSTVTDKSGSYSLYVKEKGEFILNVHYPKDLDLKKNKMPSIPVVSYARRTSRSDLDLYRVKGETNYRIKRR